MRLVYPPEGHQTFEDATFFIGSVAAPGASLSVNAQAVPVSPQGLFAWKVPLNLGSNKFTLIETQPGGQQIPESRTVARQEALRLDPLPEEPVGLLPFVSPSEDVGVQPGETVILLCPAPKGAKVTCRIEWLMNRAIDMTRVELPWDNKSGVFAQLHQVQAPWPQGEVFMAHVHVPVNTPPLPNLMVQFSIQHNESRLEFKAPGSVTILPLGKRPVARVSPNEAVVRTNPHQGARRAPLLAGTLVEISGFVGPYYRLRFGAQEAGWIARDDVSLLEGVVYPPVLPIHVVQVEPGPRAFHLVVPMERLVPLDVTLDENRVTIKLFGTTSHCDFIHYQPAVFGQGLKQVTWEQINPETIQLVLDLDSPLQGFQRVYDEKRKALVCAVKTRQSVASFPFVVAIDPGHGGEESGSTAPDGTPEKQLNLAMALQLQQALSAIEGLQVVLTRTQDETLSLAQRVERAVQAEAGLLLSLHHNALPDGRNPLEEHGVCTFYYYPFALSWAKKFQQAMARGTDFADYGVLYDSLHLCRVMEMPALLLELGFLTHPDDAGRCLDPVAQQKMVNAIAGAVVSYVKAPTA